MKLQVKRFKVGARQHLVLCDESGEMLPGQTGSTISSSVDGLTKATFNFVLIPGVIDVVDGEAAAAK